MTTGPTEILTAAAVLRAHPVGDSDLIVTLLCPGRGRIDAAARAARKSRVRFGGALRPFVVVEASIAPGRAGALAQLRGACVREDLLGAAPDYPALCAASYFTELALQAAQPGHADPALFSWWCGAVEMVARGGELAPAIATGDLGWLRVLGLLPDLRACVRCGRDLGALGHWPALAHGLWCLTCAPGERECLSGAELAALDRAARTGSPALLADIGPAGRAIAADRLTRLVRTALAAPLKSAAALDDLLARRT